MVPLAFFSVLPSRILWSGNFLPCCGPFARTCAWVQKTKVCSLEKSGAVKHQTILWQLLDGQSLSQERDTAQLSHTLKPPGWKHRWVPFHQNLPMWRGLKGHRGTRKRLRRQVHPTHSMSPTSWTLWTLLEPWTTAQAWPPRQQSRASSCNAHLQLFQEFHRRGSIQRQVLLFHENPDTVVRQNSRLTPRQNIKLSPSLQVKVLGRCISELCWVHEFRMSSFIRVVEGDGKFRFTKKFLPENNKILFKLDVHKQLLLVASTIY